MEKIFKIKSVERISRRARHSAFTDMTELNGALLICYRMATTHVSHDGIIEICRYSPQTGKRTYSRIALPERDLRDPKLSVDENGRVWLLAYCRTFDGDRVAATQMVSWFSDTGESWSSPHRFGRNFWWLWRIRWHRQQAFGFAYNRQANRIDFYRGHPAKQMECIKSHALSLERHHLGYPNESDVHFDPSGNCMALVRRDADSYSAQYGESRPPFTRWYWHDLQQYIGGPVWLWLDKGHALIAGRDVEKNKPVTRVWLFTRENKKMTALVNLPSAGDNSYPGLHIQDDTLFVSYYSDHVDNETRVYLARVAGMKKLRDIIKQR